MNLNLSNPVYVLEWGKWNFRVLGNLPKDELESYNRYEEKLIRQALKDEAADNGEGVIIIIDWDGFSFTHFASAHGQKYKLFFNLTPYKACI